MPKKKAKSKDRQFTKYDIELIVDDGMAEKLIAYATYHGWRDLLSRGQKAPKEALRYQVSKEAIRAAVYHFIGLVAECERMPPPPRT